MRRSCFPAAILATVTSSAALAQTQPDKQQCVDAYTHAQVLRTKDKLVLSKNQLEVCTAAACPEALRKDCTTWLAEVQQNIPLLSVDVVDESGHALPTAHVTIDGNTVATGQAINLDPGPHTVQADAPGMIAGTESVELAKGEKRRATVTLKAQAAAELPPAVHRPVPVAAIVLASLGAVGIGGFIGFCIAGNSLRGTLDASCKPTRSCNPSDVDTIKTDYVIADVSLGVGIVSLAAATVLFIVGYTSAPPKEASGSVWRSLSIAGGPLPAGGGVVGVTGRFY